MSIRAVIFDMGGVLIETPFQTWKDLEAKRGFEAGTFISILRHAPFTEQLDRLERGTVTAEEFDSLFTDYCNEKFERTDESIPLISTFIEGLYDMKIHPIMIELLEDLRAAGYKTALLTNNAYADRARLAPTLPKGIEDYFDVIVESCRLGIRKPESAIYERVCDQLELRPEDCIFLDDLDANILAAREMGMTAIKVTSPARAAEELRRILDLYPTT